MRILFNIATNEDEFIASQPAARQICEYIQHHHSSYSAEILKMAVNRWVISISGIPDNIEVERIIQAAEEDSVIMEACEQELTYTHNHGATLRIGIDSIAMYIPKFHTSQKLHVLFDDPQFQTTLSSQTTAIVASKRQEEASSLTDGPSGQQQTIMQDNIATLPVENLSSDPVAPFYQTPSFWLAAVGCVFAIAALSCLLIGTFGLASLPIMAISATAAKFIVAGGVVSAIASAGLFATSYYCKPPDGESSPQSSI